MDTKENKGITLISLVITIIIIIILSSIAIYLSLGNNGIFTRAKQAKNNTNKQEATDIINLKITTAQMNKYAEEQRMPTLKELSVILGADDDIKYVTEKSKVAVAEYDVPSANPSSIYTKLNKYPYEFEINSSLQLASIDGIKINVAQTSDETNMCNPKLLTKMSLPNSEEQVRNKNYYYANTSAYNKNDTENFSKYLSYDEKKGWNIKQSGWYLIHSNGMLGNWNGKETVYENYLIVDENKYMIDHISATNCPNRTSNWMPIYLKEGTVINFYNSLNDSCSWHYVEISIYALFN